MPYDRYKVKIVREKNEYVARDKNGDWRTRGEYDRDRTGRDLAEYLFHSNEIESCEVNESGVTVCWIIGS
jgi:hypothetical protein